MLCSGRTAHPPRREKVLRIPAVPAVCALGSGPLLPHRQLGSALCCLPRHRGLSLRSRPQGTPNTSTAGLWRGRHRAIASHPGKSRPARPISPICWATPMGCRDKHWERLSSWHLCTPHAPSQVVLGPKASSLEVPSAAKTGARECRAHALPVAPPGPSGPLVPEFAQRHTSLRTDTSLAASLRYSPTAHLPQPRLHPLPIKRPSRLPSCRSAVPSHLAPGRFCLLCAVFALSSHMLHIHQTSLD